MSSMKNWNVPLVDSWDRPKGPRWPAQVKPSGYFTAYGERCRFCKRGILWVRRGDTKRQVAIEPESWTGEAWYFKGRHVPHVRRCEKMRGAFERWKIEHQDLLV